MPRKYTEDYFEHTKMTFGQHLNELRSSLWKAVLALFLGFVIGLLFGKWIVNRITDPLENALTEYYQEQNVTALAQKFAEKEGRDLPTEEDTKAATEIIQEGNKTFEPRYFEYDALRDLFIQFLNEINPELAADASSQLESRKTAGKSKLIELLVYSNVADDPRIRVMSTGVQEPFMVYIKASLLAGAIFSSPFVFYFVWQFVAAGLFPHEKNYVYVFGPFSLALFLAGAALAFFAVIGLVLDFLFTFNSAMGIDPDPRISEWLSFVMLLPIGFGVSFQLPLVMLFMERIGILSVKTYIDKWRMSVLIISILSMVLTPADPGSMILMFVPLTILYFGGIGLCRLWPRRTTPFGEEIE